MKVKLSDLASVASKYEGLKVTHEGKIKDLRNIESHADNKFIVTLRVARSVYYTMDGNDTIELLTNNMRFLAVDIILLFGSGCKIRRNNWLPGHYASPLSSSLMLDNMRGLQEIDQYTVFYLYDEEWAELEINRIDSAKQAFILDPESTVLCGFELETESTEGYNRDSEFEDCRQEQIDLLMDEGPIRIPIRLLQRYRERLSDKLRAIVDADDREKYNSFLDEEDIIDIDTLIELGHITYYVKDRIRDYYWDLIDDEPEGDMVERLSNMLSIPNNMAVEYDGSVNGFEFVTIGGQSVDSFQQNLEHITKFDHEITTRCSFHIHLSVDNLKHSYDREQRQRIIHYLFDNSHRLPHCVAERLKNNDANYFFLPDNGNDKMNFINFHSQGTIEFRCFGNVRTAEEGMICLQLAIEALQYSYSNSTLRVIDDEVWGRLARSAMEDRDNVVAMKQFASAQLAYMKVLDNNNQIMERLQPEIQKLSTAQFSIAIGE